MAYRLTRRACRDVLKIWCRIAEDNEPAADRFIDSGDRSFPVGEYLIFYRVMTPGVHIMHVVHGRMDLRRYPFD